MFNGIFTLSKLNSFASNVLSQKFVKEVSPSADGLQYFTLAGLRKALPHEETFFNQFLTPDTSFALQDF